VDDTALQQLLDDARAGDHTAFEAIHALLEAPLLRFTRRLVGDEQTAQDVVQETLMTLYLHLASIDPPAKLRPFCFRVARNRCYDLLRRSGRFEQVELPDDDMPRVRVSFTGHSEKPLDDTTHWLLLHLEVREAMERLPELQRQTLLLYAEEGMSYGEISEIMGVSIGTVKSRLFYAKRMLRGSLRRETLAAIMSEMGETEVMSDESKVMS
jgi:RNA polymerase sigma-70 factor, ECF subfamily